jgi:glutamyl-tRNA synthetase
MIEAFTLKRINRSNSIFNYRKEDPKFFTDPKALSVNAHYIREMELSELGPQVTPFLEDAELWNDAYDGDKKEWYLSTLDLIRERFHTLKDFAVVGRAYFGEGFEIEERAMKKNIVKNPQLREWLPILGERFEALGEFNQETAEATARALCDELEVKPGVIINGMRTVVTGRLAGPSMFDALIAIGRERVVMRLKEVEKVFALID